MGSAGSEAIKFSGGETRRGLEPLENDLLQTVGLTESGELDTDQASSSSSSSGTGLEGGAELISSYPLIYRGKKKMDVYSSIRQLKLVKKVWMDIYRITGLRRLRNYFP